jgi:hypothetical protein
MVWAFMVSVVTFVLIQARVVLRRDKITAGIMRNINAKYHLMNPDSSTGIWATLSPRIYREMRLGLIMISISIRYRIVFQWIPPTYNRRRVAPISFSPLPPRTVLWR